MAIKVKKILDPSGIKALISKIRLALAKKADASAIPTSLPSPAALDIVTGDSTTRYDGAAAKSVTINPDSIGAIPRSYLRSDSRAGEIKSMQFATDKVFYVTIHCTKQYAHGELYLYISGDYNNCPGGMHLYASLLNAETYRYNFDSYNGSNITGFALSSDYISPTFYFKFAAPNNGYAGIEYLTNNEVEVSWSETEPAGISFIDTYVNKFVISSFSPLYKDSIPYAVVTDNVASSDKLHTSRTLLANLASEAGASFDGRGDASIGVTGVLPVSHGGTGQSTAIAAANSLVNALTLGASDPVDDDFYIAQFAGGGTSTTTYHRCRHSSLWNYIRGKISSVLGLTKDSYGGTANKANYLNVYAENEVNFQNYTATGGALYFNCRGYNADSSPNKISRYKFCDRNGMTAGVTLEAESFTGNSATASKLLSYPAEALAGSSDTGTALSDVINHGGGVYLTQSYQDANAPGFSGNVLHLIGAGGGQLFAQWTDDRNGGHLFYRSHRDNNGSGSWTDWKKIAYTDDNVASASWLKGFAGPSGDDWGVQTGTCINAFQTASGGAIQFRDNCPNESQVSMLIDGNVYVNEGRYQVVDVSTIGSLNAGSATKLQKARTIWGQSFDGSGNVSGTLDMAHASIVNIEELHAESNPGYVIGHSYNSSNHKEEWHDDSGLYHAQYGLDGRNHNHGVYSTTLSDYFGLSLHTYKGILSMQTDGNVGIGTYAPDTKLTVNGGTLSVFPGDTTLYDEGIRVHASSDKWSILMLCAADNTGASGTSPNSWGVLNHNGTLYINRGGASEHTGNELCCVNRNWGIGTVSPAYKLDVAGTLRATGDIYENKSKLSDKYLNKNDYIAISDSKIAECFDSIIN